MESEDEIYLRAFAKFVAGETDKLTEDEARILESRRNEDGSYPVPAEIDPTV